MSAFSFGLLAYVGIRFFGKNPMTAVIILLMLTWTTSVISVIAATRAGR